ncbi:MAG TPA: hypothetical protein VFP56_12150, partial [Candidatus Limnocylindrales bacterium]|nr:hypothetical protein [Candidatus Limnocylindrales bacterium]
NSAFMHMVRDEDNKGYRRLIRETLAADPRVLERFVNFMTNPDERPVAEQFGTGDKAFAAATLLATLPGLPMLGHGQVEGFRERYGMEFRKARWDEPVDQSHADHFAWAIVPLLRRRAAFSGTSDFHLYDARRDDGAVDENVYAYSNGRGADRSLVLVHHHYGETTVRVDWSMAAAAPGGSGGSGLTSVRLADALALEGPDEQVVRLVDHRSGYELRSTHGDLRREGLRVSLGAYEARVLAVEGDIAPSKPPTERVEPVQAKRNRRRPVRPGAPLSSPAPLPRPRRAARRRSSAPPGG